MIIVKTSNGDVFINDKATIIVKHDREAKKVYVQTAGGYVNPIENVEGVIYTNDAQRDHRLTGKGSGVITR